MTLAADLLLLAIDPERRKVRANDKIDYALMGADLVDLAIAERVTVLDERIHVTDRRPTGDQCLDAALATLAAARKPPRAKTWVQSVRTGVRKDYLAVLERETAIRPQVRPFLRVFTRIEFNVLDASRRADVRARLDAVAAGAEPRDARDRALAGLTHACGLDGVLFPGAPNRAYRSRLKEAAKHDGISADVIEAARSATDAAVDAATDAAVHAATSAAVDATHHAGYSGHDGGGGGGGHH